MQIDENETNSVGRRNFWVTKSEPIVFPLFVKRNTFIDFTIMAIDWAAMLYSHPRI